MSNKNNKKQKVVNSKKKWKDIKITKELRDIIHGYIASDGNVSSEGILTVDHGEKQEKFVQWLYQKLEKLRTDNTISTVTRTDKRTGKKTISKRFNTRTLLKGFHKMWYQSYIDDNGNTKYKKRLPNKIEGFFSSTFLAVWFAGDGTKIVGSRGAKYEVTSLTVDERHQLQRLFKKKFDIDAVIIRSGESKKGSPQWALSINAPDYDKFRALITKIDLIPTIFPYKLHRLGS
uniref:Homing endonuclease LAGLIDADG domain-containing protein n=1 Tax=Chlamydomonas moewusii TaxID=3054 RepID=Q02449_CHLMO|nr:putative protein of 231 amino acids [Chlamydomonas moewusii]